MIANEKSAKSIDGAQSIRRAVSVLRILATGQDRGVRLRDVAFLTGLSTSTAHRILKVLIAEGLADQESPNRCYAIGREASLLGLARHSSIRIRDIASPHLHELCELTGDSAFLTVRSGGDSICVDRATGKYPIQVFAIDIGARRPLGIGVGGLAILASLPPQEIDLVLNQDLRRLAHYGVSMKKLKERITATLALGFAYTEAGIVRGTRAVSVALLAHDGRPVGAISISAMAARLPFARARQLAAIMQAHSMQISRGLLAVKQSTQRGKSRLST